MGNGKKGIDSPPPIGKPDALPDNVIQLEKREQEEIDKRIQEAKINNLRLRIAELQKATPESEEINELQEEIKRLETPETEVTPQSEDGTPKENRRRFLDVMARAEEMLGPKTEGERYTDYLLSRVKELDAKLASITEDGFRWLGKKYNEHGLKTKLAVGLSLGVGAGASFAAGAFLPGALFLLGVGVQRSAAMASMFLKYEKSTSDKKWLGLGKKEKAMGKAMLYTAGMTVGMLALVEGVKEGVEYANQQQWGERMHEWLGHMLGHENAAIHTAPPVVTPEHIITPPVHEVPIIPEMPAVSASPHGYEGMLKQLWSQLQEKHITLPADADPQSDLVKLLTADKSSLDGVVHRLATEHGFFHPDGTSVLIDPSAHLTIMDGQLHFADAAHPDMVHAAENMGTTPAYHPEVPAPATATPSVEAVSVPPPPVESAAVPKVEPLPAAATPIPDNSVWHDSSGNVIHDAEGNPVYTGTHEAPSGEAAIHAEVAASESIVNHFGLTVPTNESHFYADSGAKHLFVYGGSPLERAQAIQDYLHKNPNSTVFSADDSGKYRIPWHLVGGKATPEAPVQTRGFLGFFKSFMKAPEPEEFEKRIN